VTTTAAWSFDDKAIREDLLDILTNIDPTESNFMDSVPTTQSTAVLHEWLTDTLDAPGDNANIEGADLPTVALTNPGRANNKVQNFQKSWKVTGTEMAVTHAGFSSRKALEVQKKLKSLKNDMEYTFIRGTAATGDGSTTATRLKGVKSAISTLSTSQSGVSLSETILNQYLQNSWTNGGRVNALYVGGVLKQRITGFSANNTRTIDATGKTLINTINVYQGDFGAPLVEVKLHRYITVANDANYDIVGLQEDTWAVSYLRKPQNMDIAPTGDAVKGLLVAEATIEYRAEKANFKALAHY
jgi:hypothetical protein